MMGVKHFSEELVIIIENSINIIVKFLEQVYYESRTVNLLISKNYHSFTVYSDRVNYVNFSWVNVQL